MKRILPLLLIVLSAPAVAQSPALKAETGAQVFAEARGLADADGGALWGLPLYGSMLLVEDATRRVVANAPATGLRQVGNVFVGILPDSVLVANTATVWDETTWTMLLWPLPEDDFARRALVAHELWHRVQDTLGFPMSSAPNLHLGTRNGRLWLRLEWRALAEALRHDGDTRRAALYDALLFRAQRHALFPPAPQDERSLLMHEGLAEYTGAALAGPSRAAARARVAANLRAAEDNPTFVRSFAYASGPAYGLLLDEVAPTWRNGLQSSDDLAALAAKAIGFAPPADLEAQALQAIRSYDGDAVVADEDERARERAERLRMHRQRLVEGPVLRLGFVRMRVQFDPREVDALDERGNVYPSMQVTDAWGVLTVTGGALIAADWQSVVVPAPEASEDAPEGRIYRGDGYTLALADGWRLAPGNRAGDLYATPVAE